MHRLTLLILIVISVTLCACEDCGPTDEPTLYLTIQSQIPFRVDTLYGLGATGQFAGRPDFSSTAISNYQLLPLNLNADSTRYALTIDGRSATITVYYRRNFYYKNPQCGYVFDLQSPSSDIRRQARTTRGTIASVKYAQNLFDGGFLRSGTDTGIHLSIQL